MPDPGQIDQVLDVRGMPKSDKHPAIFAAYDALSPGEALILVNDHDPKHLRDEFELDRAGSFSWDYVSREHRDWRIRIAKLTNTPEDFSADLEHEHRLIDAGIETYLDLGSQPLEQRRTDLVHAIGLLRRHIYYEEEQLFPRLRTVGLVGPLAVMVHEHGQLWPLLDRLEGLVDSDAVAAKPVCRDLLAQLATHNWKEEGVVYAQARQLLPEADRLELSDCLANTELPEGWVSQGVGAT